MTDAEWLLALYAAENGEEAIDNIFEKFDELLCNESFDRCDALLQSVDVERLSSNLLVAFLCITLMAKRQLHSRSALVHRIEAMLSKTNPHRLEQLLAGLR